MAPIGNLSMNTWIGGVFSFSNGTQEYMYSIYYKPFDFGPFPSPPVLGLARWNDAREEFEAVNVFPNDNPLKMSGDHVTQIFRAGEQVENE